MESKSNEALDEAAIKQLEELVSELESDNGPFGKDVSKKDGNVIMLDYWTSPLALRAMRFLYDNKLIVDFDWPRWKEFKVFINDTNSEKYDVLDREFVLKILTVFARSDRFSDGAWASSFESGVSQRLFSRLLEIEGSQQ